jgi:thiamine pyrophosphokinase
MMINIIIGSEIRKNYQGQVIGVDKSAYYLIEAGYSDFVAIGDFDSCNEEEFRLIGEKARVVKHPSIKDCSDLELAIDYCLEHFNEDITIHNIYAGNRLDHLYANILLLKKGISKGITIYHNDSNNCAYVLTPNKYKILTLKQYISFFALEEVNSLSLIDFKYPLEGYRLKVGDPLCVSNAVTTTSKLEFDSGLLLVIESND